MPSSSDALSHTTRDKRAAAGKALRDATPREALARLDLPVTRDPLAVLAETDRMRLPDLVPERYARMRVSPFSFFRGAAAVMAEDLRSGALVGIPVQACGDCHIGNFGVLQSPENSLLFDINDFDETLPGIDFTIDVKRLCASVALAVLESSDATGDEAQHAARAAAHAYRTRIAELAGLSPLEIATTRTDLNALMASVADDEVRHEIQGFVEKAASGQGSAGNFQRLSADSKAKPPNEWRLADKPPNLFHWTEGAKGRETLRAADAFMNFRESLPPERRTLVARYDLTDVAFKVVGVGSVGTFCAVGLFTTADGATLFLQIKEASASVLTRLGGHDAFTGHQGERVVQGQRLMQAASDVFLGWTTEGDTGRQFYVRHLKNKRLGEIAPLIQGHALGAYGKICGATLAQAHARSGDAASMAGYMGDSAVFDDAIATYAMAYAAQTKKDFNALLAKPDIGTAKTVRALTASVQRTALVRLDALPVTASGAWRPMQRPKAQTLLGLSQRLRRPATTETGPFSLHNKIEAPSAHFGLLADPP